MKHFQDIVFIWIRGDFRICISVPLSKTSKTYENCIVMGDFSIDKRNKGREYDKLEDVCSFFNLSNLIKSETCSSKNHKSTIDLFTTNKPNCFQHTHVTETGPSYFNKMISTFF